MLLKDRVAIISGGGKGMGKGMAIKFAEEGCAHRPASSGEAAASGSSADVSRPTDRGSEGKRLNRQKPADRQPASRQRLGAGFPCVVGSPG